MMERAAEEGDLGGAADQRMRRWTATALLFSIVCGAPATLLLVLDNVVGLLGPWINLDLLVVYIVALWVTRASPRLAAWIATLGVFATLGVQLLIGVGLIYIEDPALIPEYLAFAPYWPWRVIAMCAAMALVAFAAIFLLLRQAWIGRAYFAPALVMLVVFLALDLFSRTAAGYDVVRANLATSSAVRLGGLVARWLEPAPFEVRPFPGATMQSDLARLQPPPGRILSISFESLGSATDPRYDEAQLAPLLATLGKEYRVERTVHAFRGATLAGEVRELCGLRIAGTPSAAHGRLLRPHCAPARLATEGYATLGIHGNSRFFYNRANLYPAIGFGHTLFFDDLKAQGRSVCRTRAFTGICDVDAVGAALEFLARSDKAFAHVMTLDTHFPLGSRSPGDEHCRSGVSPPSRALCLYQNQVAATFAQIAAEIARAEPRPDLIYIYGDHAPPYVVGSERAYFDRERVPVIILTRRAAAAGP